MTARATRISSFPKACSCGGSWTREEWRGLRLVGRMEHRGKAIELRNCTCDSTLAVPEGREPVDVDGAPQGAGARTVEPIIDRAEVEERPRGTRPRERSPHESGVRLRFRLPGDPRNS